MQMDAGLDTGPIIDAARVAIEARETAGTLEAKLAEAGGRVLTHVLRCIAAGQSLARVAQPPAGATLAPKLRATEAAIDWNASATAIDRQIRAFDPAPGAYAAFDGQRVKVWRAEPVETAPGLRPGTVVESDSNGIVVACGSGSMRLAELQPAGGRRMPAAAFLAGRRRGQAARFDPGVGTGA